MAPTRSSDNTLASQERLQTLEERLQEVLDQQTTLMMENNALRERVATLTSLPGEFGSSEVTQPMQATSPHVREMSTAPTAVTTTSSGRNSEPKVASPEYYHGQRNKLATFITQVTMVITLQATRFPSEVSKVLYAGSFLRDTAFLWFQPYVTADPQPSFMTDFKEFCRELKNTFGDPDEIATAERQLYALRQKGSVTSYVTEFMRFAVLVKWNDEAKAAQFYRGLKDGIKDELSRIGKPSSLKELEDVAIRIDTRLFERQVERGERTSPANYTSSNPPRFTPRPVPTFTKTQTTYTRPSENLRAAFQPRPDTTTRKGKLTPAEYQRRKDSNLCLYCGDKGHQVIKCPLAPPAKVRSNLRSATISLDKTDAPTASGKA